jgi:lysophospholipase L1-like esterase
MSLVVTAQKKKRLSPAKAVLFIVVACVGFFVLLEALLRVFGYSGYQIDFGVYRNVPGDITPRQRLVHRVPSVGVEYPITINSQGFRGAGRIRPESAARILCLGDSSTMGYGVGDAETYPARLATFLDGTFPGVFDVLNAGSIGYTISDELGYLEEKGDVVKPDVVILEVFYNDVIEESFRKETQRDFRRNALPYTALKSLLLKSAVYHVLRNAYVLALAKAGRYFPENPIDKMDMAMFPERFPKEWKAYESKLEKLVQYVRARNMSLLLLISPHQYQVYSWGYPFGAYYHARGYQDRIIEIAKRLGIPYVDLLPAFQEEAKRDQAVFLTYGLYDEHESDIGQLLKARAVFAALMEVLEQDGFYNLYGRFEEAQIRRLSGDGAVFRGRQWRSRGDAPSLILRPDVAIEFPGLKMREHSWLRFSAGIAPWSRVTDQLSLRVLAADRSSSRGQVLLYDARMDSAGKNEPIDVLKSLSGASGGDVSLTFELTTIRQGASEQPGEKDNEVYISNPIIYVTKRNVEKEGERR